MIQRDVQDAARRDLDVVIIGGGIHGACALLEASRRGLRAHLLERDDFGGATSWNSFGILHGGLRYLQTLDLARFRESVAERTWFCRHFPDLVRPLPCLMPLYDRGLKRRSVFRAALALNDRLSRDRNRHLDAEHALPDGRLLSIPETIEMFPGADPVGLRGGAVWHDATMTSAQRLLMEILRWACAAGGTASNYVAAVDLDVRDGRVVGVSARDRISGRTVELETRAAINCAGPWSRGLAATFDRDVPDLGRPSLAFNLLIDRRPLSGAALAVQDPRAGGQVYLIRSYGDRLLVGTLHAPWTGDPANPRPRPESVRALLEGLSRVVPGLDLTEEDVLRVYAGILPAVAAGSDKATSRSVIHDHGRHGGPRGLVSVCGIKYTTARAVAGRALGAVDPTWKARPYRTGTERPIARTPLDPCDPDLLLDADAAFLAEHLSPVVREEAVVTWDDLLHRRTDWGHDPGRLPSLRQRAAELLGEDALRDAVDPTEPPTAEASAVQNPPVTASPVP